MDRLGVRLLQAGDNGFGERGEVNGTGNQFRPADARQMQKVVNQPSHALRFGANAIKVLVSLRIEALAVIFQQRLAPAVDAAQGSAQVVRNGVRKGFQFPVGRLPRPPCVCARAPRVRH